jgi:hypothetical protein
MRNILIFSVCTLFIISSCKKKEIEGLNVLPDPVYSDTVRYLNPNGPIQSDRDIFEESCAPNVIMYQLVGNKFGVYSLSVHPGSNLCSFSKWDEIGYSNNFNFNITTSAYSETSKTYAAVSKINKKVFTYNFEYNTSKVLSLTQAISAPVFNSANHLSGLVTTSLGDNDYEFHLMDYNVENGSLVKQHNKATLSVPNFNPSEITSTKYAGDFYYLSGSTFLQVNPSINDYKQWDLSLVLNLPSTSVFYGLEYDALHKTFLCLLSVNNNVELLAITKVGDLFNSQSIAQIPQEYSTLQDYSTTFIPETQHYILSTIVFDNNIHTDVLNIDVNSGQVLDIKSTSVQLVDAVYAK